MSAPSYMMEAEFEPEGYDYGDYGDYESECIVCAGFSYIKKIYISTKD